MAQLASAITKTFTVTDVVSVDIIALADCDFCEVGEQPAVDGSVTYPFYAYEPNSTDAPNGILQFIGALYTFRKSSGCAYRIGETIGSVKLGTAGSATFKRRGA